MLYCCVHLKIEALNENIGRWETTWFTFIYCIFKCFNFVGYGLYHLVADHLSRIENGEDNIPIQDDFLDEVLLALTTVKGMFPEP